MAEEDVVGNVVMAEEEAKAVDVDEHKAGKQAAEATVTHIATVHM